MIGKKKMYQFISFNVEINPFRFPEIFNVENICMPNRTYYNREMSNGHGNIPAINNFSMNKTFICRSLL